MYCPRCAAQNLDDAKFCRACGADIRLVPQALQGTLHAAFERPENDEAATARGKEKKRTPATIDAGLKDIFSGLGLFIIFLIGLFVFHGAFWVTVWFIIPALASVGEGIGKLIRARQEQTLLTATPYESGNFHPAPFTPAPIVKELSSPDTTKIVRAPASVTDGTTRHLDAPSKTR
ncbi:MAG: zinc-ribbon domain-containing protein [Acidobacteria bacterium]|nr:zinc-ribbon domain-containing protein [Acidobacteriota bacterium]